MISDNTLDILNQIGFGADIGKLESYLDSYGKCLDVVSMKKYGSEYTELCNIMHDIKPTQTYKNDNVSYIENNEYDEFIGEQCYSSINEVFNTSEIGIKRLATYIQSQNSKQADILALANVEGLPFVCNYINGYVYNAFIVKNGKKVINITDIYKDNERNYIEELKSKPISTIFGIVTIMNNYPDEQYSYKNLECSVMHIISLRAGTEKLSFICDNIYFKDINITNWEKIQLLRQLGFKVPHHGMLRNITCENIGEAIKELSKYIYKYEEDKKIQYKYYGICIKFCNASKIDSNTSIIYNDINSSYNRRYKAKIKRIDEFRDGDKIVNNIILDKVRISRKEYIDNLIIDDITNLDELNIMPGNQIIIKIINGKAVL